MPRAKTQAKPYFSIVIPCLNEEHYLPDLLNDIMKQSCTDFEVLVVDGKSKDKTVEQARQFNKTRVIISPKRNVGFQRNLGGQQAKGTYLIFFDADTRIPAYFLEGIKYHCTVEHPDAFTTWMKVDSDKPADKTISAFINFSMESSKNLAAPTAYGAMIGCRKTVFDLVNGFDTSITFGEDSEIVRRIVKLGFLFKLFRDPQFTYSLRRFRKEGTLNLLQKYARLDINLMFNKYPRDSDKLYPMIGGEYYNKKQISPMLSWLQEFSDNMKQQKPTKLSDLIKKIFTE